MMSFKLAVLSLSLTFMVSAENYYIEPATGAIGNDGSAGSPWNTLAAVASSKTFEDGDSLFLGNGDHGEVTVDGQVAGTVTVLRVPGARPVLRKLTVRRSSDLVFQGLHLCPDSLPLATQNIAHFRVDAEYCTMQSCTLYSQWDVAGWDSTDWKELPANGIKVEGRNNTLRNNYGRNLSQAVNVLWEADSVLVEGNRFEYWTSSCIQCLGSYGRYLNNEVLRSMAPNGNHDALGFVASNSSTDTIRGLTFIGNTQINYLEPDHPFQYNPQAQGIGLWKGGFRDVVMENNVYYGDAYQGFAVTGCADCRIVNNTAVSQTPSGSKRVRVAVYDHKDGTPSTGCVVRNNIAHKMLLNGEVTEDHNLEIDNDAATLEEYFAGYNAYDLHLKAGSPAIGAGSVDLAPSTDHDGVARSSGSGVDAGAYEYVAPAGITELHSINNFENIIVFPNPVRGTVVITAAGPVYIYDAVGRVVFRSVHVANGGVQHVEPLHWRWNGTDTNGNPVSDGTYFVHAGTVIKKIMVIR